MNYVELIVFTVSDGGLCVFLKILKVNHGVPVNLLWHSRSLSPVWKPLNHANQIVKLDEEFKEVIFIESHL